MNDKIRRPRPVELLSPARDAKTAIAAIDHGADAVYMGASSHGARVSAGNPIGEIAHVVDYAHRFDVKVYVTVNTLVYEDELESVRSLITDLYRVGVDALIVQDMSILEMDIPPIALHASTQCDTRDAAKARFLEQAGFSQIVLARELSLDEIRDIAGSVTVPLEAFVHGALCVSFSGDCRASLLATGRSANRGECAQMCRLPYDLTDGDGKVLVAGKHLLSLKDMNRLDHLESMLEAGVSSFKIEGRLKDEAYVRNVTAAYRQALDRIIGAHPDRYRRSSSGTCRFGFVPSPENVFNRGFTSYFLTDRQPRSIASLDTPKSVGRQIGKVISVGDGYVTVDTDVEIANGDGLSYFDRTGRVAGFRANSVKGNRIYVRERVNVSPGTKLYRNRDSRLDREMKTATATRTVDVAMTLRRVDESRVALDVSMSGGPQVSAVVEAPFAESRSPQRDQRRRVLGKLGDTPYMLSSLEDLTADDDFIAASTLTRLRRDAVGILDQTRRATYSYDRRRPDSMTGKKPEVTFRDNVSNSLAEKFYRDHGAVTVDKAAEVIRPSGKEMIVMECRYCIRRELGACLKTGGAHRLPSPLYLRSGNNRYRLDFDCRRCQMRVIAVK